MPQWKFLHNIYPTNILLNTMNARDSDTCMFCPDSTDYIVHFFCGCPKVVKFWKFFQQGLRVELSVKTILFGVENCIFARCKVIYINHIVLVAKICMGGRTAYLPGAK